MAAPPPLKPLGARVEQPPPDDIYTAIEWDPDIFGVGTEVIDKQHMHLLRLINRICQIQRETQAHGAGAEGELLSFVSTGTDGSPSHAARRRRQPPCDRFFDQSLQKGSKTGELIDELVTYCGKHLANEAYLLETYGYPDRVAHVQEHDIFVGEVSKAWRLMEEHNLELADLNHLIAFLKNWLHTHIPKDRRFRELLLEKGYGAA